MRHEGARVTDWMREGILREPGVGVEVVDCVGLFAGLSCANVVNVLFS